LENILDFRHTNSTLLSADECRNKKLSLTGDILSKKLIDVNNIKNFLNQSLLHFVCESSDTKLCELLIEHGADCLLEDNYRQTPFIIAVKRNNLEFVRLFVKAIKSKYQLVDPDVQTSENLSECWKQVRRASYYASCSGNLEILRYIFESFRMRTEHLLNDFRMRTCSHLSLSNRLNHFSELNPLHVSCYKANFLIVEFLLENLSPERFEALLNMPINDFRDSTCLEEAFKGLIMMDVDVDKCLFMPNKNSKRFVEFKSKKSNYVRIINLLIEKGAKFSKSFSINEGLVKLLNHSFSGPNKDQEFIHFLNSCTFLFKYNLNELFYVNLVNEEKKESSFLNVSNSKQEMEQCEKNLNYHDDQGREGRGEDLLNRKTKGACTRSLESSLPNQIYQFLFQTYLTCLKVIKDYKAISLKYFSDIVFSLHYSGQININLSRFDYLKQRTPGLFELLRSNLNTPLSLRAHCAINVRKSINNFGFNKVNQLKIPECLKNDIFLNNIPHNIKYEIGVNEYFPFF
jgi:ankyrin repeat protein